MLRDFFESRFFTAVAIGAVLVLINTALRRKGFDTDNMVTMLGAYWLGYIVGGLDR